MYIRISKPLKSNSFFMFGARGTGKTSLFKELFKAEKALTFNLLDDKLYSELISRPELFEQRVLAEKDKIEWVIVDEVQKIPQLLNYVHKLIEETKIKFALTGSSSRKLKKSGANLLGGRALMNALHPLTYVELGSDFILDDILNWGSLPYILNSKDELTKKEILKSYVSIYLRQEIKEEQIVRQLDPFVRFLEVAAQHNGKIINAAKIGRESSVDTSAIIRYFEILIDTLIGFYLEPYHTSVRKLQSGKSKFYFFDIGVKRALQNSLESRVIPKTFSYGDNFEHFFILECIRLNDYYRRSLKFYYLRTKDDVEIDLIVEFPENKNKWAIEIKSSSKIDENEFTYQVQLALDIKADKFIVASQEIKSRLAGQIEIHNWRKVLEMIFRN